MGGEGVRKSKGKGGKQTNLGSSHFCFCRRDTSVFPSIGEDGVGYFFHCPLDFWRCVSSVDGHGTV